MELWDSDIGNVVHISQNPADGNIYLVGLFPGEIRRISYAGNLKPVIEVTPDTVYGTSPLIVQFDASESYDPEGTELTFSWDFGDGTQGNGSNIVHEFNAASSAPESFEVSLVVTDADGKFAEKNLLVSVNNTPPMAEITGFEENYLYPIVGLSDLNLEAEFWDNESSAEELNIDWKVYLHHNTHYHLEYTYHEQQQNTTIQPLGCGIETFWYRVDLQVTDPQGLQYKVSREVFPDCSGSSDTNDSTTVSESFTIYPNPANDLVTLQFTKPLGDWLNIELYSIHGHLVKSYYRTPTEGTTKNIISVSGLPAGIYILVCETPQWQQTQKISVVKN